VGVCDLSFFLFFSLFFLSSVLDVAYGRDRTVLYSVIRFNLMVSLSLSFASPDHLCCGAVVVFLHESN